MGYGRYSDDKGQEAPRTPGDIECAVAAGIQSADTSRRLMMLNDMKDGIAVVLLNKDQRLEVPEELMDKLEERLPKPRRRVGCAVHQEMASFINHVLRFKHDDSAIFADVREETLTAIFDYHPANADHTDARWAEHRSQYTCPLSPEWLAWTSKDRKTMRQDDFGDFLEEYLHDMTSGPDYPTPIDLLEMAREMRIHTQGRYERKLDKTSGESTLVCTTETGASSTKVPRAFLIAIPVFLGGTVYKIECRMQLRMHDGMPQLSYYMHRREEFKRDAFSDVRDMVHEKTELPVFAGKPE